MSDMLLSIAATARTPAVSLDAATGRLSLSGESYPEDAGRFYSPVMEAVSGYLEQVEETEILVEVAMVYFNSSSAKALMNLFQMLEEAAEADRSVSVRWFFDPDDDMMEELGEDFAEDFVHATFSLEPGMPEAAD